MPRPHRARWRPRLPWRALLAVTVTVAACGAGTNPHTAHQSPQNPAGSTAHPSTAAPATTAHGSTRLPRGGSKIFPQHRVVAYYGSAGGSALGVLGSRPPNQIAEKIEHTAARYATPRRTVRPAMELIATIADSRPGPHGCYCHSITMAKARAYLRAAKAHHMLLILDIQPGRQRFLPLVKHWKPLLAQPGVGLALDSEWHMPDGGIPGQRIGHAGAAQINRVGAWLAHLTRTRRLPQKLFVLHQFTDAMIGHIDRVTDQPELAEVQHLDGFGAPTDKRTKYRRLQRPHQFHMGFKLFYSQDTRLMTPAQVMHLHPPPDYISYQ